MNDRLMLLRKWLTALTSSNMGLRGDQCSAYNKVSKQVFIHSLLSAKLFSQIRTCSDFLPLPLSTSCHAAKEYVDSDPSGRRGLPITTIKQGAEPPTFTGWFQAWDLKMWETDPLDRIRGKF